MCTLLGEGGSIPALSDAREGAGRIHPPAGGVEVVADQPASFPMGRGGDPEVRPVCLDAGNEVARDPNRGAVERVEDEGGPAPVVSEVTSQRSEKAALRGWSGHPPTIPVEGQSPTPQPVRVAPEKRSDDVVVVDREDVLVPVFQEGLRALDSGCYPAGQFLGTSKHAPCLCSDIPQLLRVGVGQEGQPYKGNGHLIARAPRGRRGVVRGLRYEVVCEPDKRTPNIAVPARSNGQVRVIYWAVTGIFPAVHLHGEVVDRHNDAGRHRALGAGPFPEQFRRPPGNPVQGRSGTQAWGTRAPALWVVAQPGTTESTLPLRIGAATCGIAGGSHPTISR